MSTLKILLTASIWILLIHPACFSKGEAERPVYKAKKETAQQELTGMYVGLEEMCWTDSLGNKECFSDPARPERKWYHESYLRFEGDSVFLEQDPISIYKTDTLYSASDGAFYYFHGTYQAADSTVTMNFKLEHCDYCGHEMRLLENGAYEEVEQYKKLTGKIMPNGFLINNYFFKKEDNR